MSLSDKLKKAKRSMKKTLEGLLFVSGVVLTACGNQPANYGSRNSYNNFNNAGNTSPATNNGNNSVPSTNTGNNVSPPQNQTRKIEVYVGNDLTIDDGECINLHAEIRYGIPPYTFAWTTHGRGDIPSQQRDVTVCPEETTIYTFTAKDSSLGYSEDRDSVSVNVRRGEEPGAGTGVQGLFTPEEILQNAATQEALGEFYYSDTIVAYEKGISPPNIEGVYVMNGKQTTPYFIELEEGKLEWTNQTSKNTIETILEGELTGNLEGGFVSISNAGEIIRGNGEYFSVYTMQDVNVDSGYGDCSVRNLLLISGKKSSTGHIAGTYAQVPIESSGNCGTFPSAGVFDLTPVGKNRIRADNFTELDFREILQSNGYDVDFPLRSQIDIRNDEFSSYGVMLSGMLPKIFDALRPENLGGSTPIYIVTPSGGTIIDNFAHVGGDLANPWIFNFTNPVYETGLDIWDGNSNQSTHRLIAYSEKNAGGVMTDMDAFDDSSYGLNREIINLSVRSNVPIKSVWYEAQPYGGSDAEGMYYGK